MTDGNEAKVLAMRLKSATARKGIDLQQLAEAAGISRTTLYHLLEGHTARPRPATLHRIADALDVPIDELLRPNEPTALAVVTESTAARYDRATNPEVDVIARERPGLFIGWSDEDWDELYSTFGTGGALNRQGVITAAESINRKRETIRRLHIVLETHLRTITEELIDTLYRQVRPTSNLAPSEELRSIVATSHESRDELE